MSLFLYAPKGQGIQAAHRITKGGAFINLLGTFLTKFNQIFDLIELLSYAKPVSLGRIQKKAQSRKTSAENKTGCIKY